MHVVCVQVCVQYRAGRMVGIGLYIDGKDSRSTPAEN
jgi:hypothetical protein